MTAVRHEENAENDGVLVGGDDGSSEHESDTGDKKDDSDQEDSEEDSEEDSALDV
jgi:hypothetical protein